MLTLIVPIIADASSYAAFWLHIVLDLVIVGVAVVAAVLLVLRFWIVPAVVQGIVHGLQEAIRR